MADEVRQGIGDAGVPILRLWHMEQHLVLLEAGYRGARAINEGYLWLTRMGHHVGLCTS